MSAGGWRLIELPRIEDPKGRLTYLESGRQLPFDLRRVYYLYDNPEGSTRGGHALRSCRQVLVAVSGGFDVVLDDGTDRERFRLDQPSRGLYVPPMVWRTLEGFSPDAVCLALADTFFDPADYLRDYDVFRRQVGSPR